MNVGNDERPAIERIAQLAMEMSLDKKIADRAVLVYKRSGEYRDSESFIGAALLIACENTGYPISIMRIAGHLGTTDSAINQAEKAILKNFTMKNMRFDCNCPSLSDPPSDPP